MKNNPLISIIIVVYKSEKYINNCIESLRKSIDYAKILCEIIVVINDENSKKYHISNCELIKNNKNLGFAKAANIGAKKAKGDWLLFLNPDTFIPKTTIKSLLNNLFKNNETVIIASKILNPDTSLQYNIVCEPTLWNLFLEQSYLYKLFPSLFHYPSVDRNLYKRSYITNAVSGSFLMVKRTIFDKVGGFDERFFMYFEDIDLCKRLTSKYYKILFVPKAKIIHFEHQSSNGVLKGNLFVNSLYLFLYKHYGRSYASLGIIIVFSGYVLRLFYWRLIESFAAENRQKKYAIKKINYYKEALKMINIIQ